MDAPELYFFKVFADEMFPGYENDITIFAEAKAAWTKSDILASKVEIIIGWENDTI